jgi:hypothetical protein
MESFSMTRLDIGWVTHAQKPEFALSTYSRNFLTITFSQIKSSAAKVWFA